MGKINFPLVNVRKDVTSRWHMIHYTEDTAEEITVPSYSNEYGYYTTWLKEVPDSGSSTTLSTTPPKISGLTEFRGTPVDPNTKRLNLTAIQFYVNYQTGEILFHPSQAGLTYRVDYWGKGSLIEADDINNIEERVVQLEKSQDVPEFISFEIENQKLIYEIGESFPSNEIPAVVKFKWETTFPDRVKENSIKVENLTNGKVIGDNLPNTGEYELEFQESTQFSVPGILRFKITAKSINDEIFEKEIKIQWTHRLYWDVSPSKEIVMDQVLEFHNTKLLPSVDNNYNVDLQFISAVDQYKVFAIPKMYTLKYISDSKTSLGFIFDDPIELNITNQFGLEIPYLIYVSSNSIASKIYLNCQFGVN